MKFKFYLAELNKMAAEHPEKLDVEVIYTRDDERNSFQIVDYVPDFCKVEDLYKRKLEVSLGEDVDLSIEECNAILIN